MINVLHLCVVSPFPFFAVFLLALQHRHSIDRPEHLLFSFFSVSSTLFERTLPVSLALFLVSLSLSHSLALFDVLHFLSCHIVHDARCSVWSVLCLRSQRFLLRKKGSDWEIQEKRRGKQRSD